MRVAMSQLNFSRRNYHRILKLTPIIGSTLALVFFGHFRILRLSNYGQKTHLSFLPLKVSLRLTGAPTFIEKYDYLPFI